MVLYFAIVPPVLRGICYAFFGRKPANRFRALDWPRSVWCGNTLINQFFVTSIFPYQIMKTWFPPLYPNYLFCLISHFILMFDFLYLICMASNIILSEITHSKSKYVASHFRVKLFSAVFNFSNILLKFLVARGLSVFLEIFCPVVYLKNMPCLASVLENVYVKVASSKTWISAQVIVFAVLWISIFSLWV